MTRPRDYAYEALAEVTGTHMSEGRGELNAALKSIREQCEIEDSYLLGCEIYERADAYRAAMPEVVLTPSALAKHWSRVTLEATRKSASVPQTNQTASPTECATCGGDRFVVFALRKPKQSAWMKEKGIEPSGDMIEEMASCPDCNLTEISVRRHDGSYAKTPDPAKVREHML